MTKINPNLTFQEARKLSGYRFRTELSIEILKNIPSAFIIKHTNVLAELRIGDVSLSLDIVDGPALQYFVCVDGEYGHGSGELYGLKDLPIITDNLEVDMFMILMENIKNDDRLERWRMETKEQAKCKMCGEMESVRRVDQLCYSCHEYRASIERQIRGIIEKLEDKEHAIKELCRAANSNCVAIHELWCYEGIADHFGITRGDYYNDYESLSEEAKKYIMDNWKPTDNNKKDQLLKDLSFESGQFQYLKRDLDEKQAAGAGWFRGSLNHYSHQAKMLYELIEAVKEFYPSGGTHISKLTHPRGAAAKEVEQSPRPESERSEQ